MKRKEANREKERTKRRKRRKGGGKRRRKPEMCKKVQKAILVNNDPLV